MSTRTDSAAAGDRAAVAVHPRRRPVSPHSVRCIDLFSGAGGLAEGFRQAGWGVLAAADNDAYAGETFRLNFPEALFFEGSITDISPEWLMEKCEIKQSELDCLIGGPPCQSFSYNNHQRSASDERARLFRHYIRIVDVLRPKMLVMENVPGMLTIAKGQVLEEIRGDLGGLGYDVLVRILYTEDFGVPQTRRRVFIIATRVGDVDSLLPSGTHGPSKKPSERANKWVHRWEADDTTCGDFVTVGDAITDLPVIRNGGGRMRRPYAKKAKTLFQKACRQRLRILRNHTCHKLSDSMLERIREVPEGGNWTDIDEELLPAGMRRARKSDHTKRYGRLARKALASTLLTKCDPHWGAYVHPTQQRTISVREAARLQGFPDSFEFAGPFISKHYQQVGNAVPPPVARAIAMRAADAVQPIKV